MTLLASAMHATQRVISNENTIFPKELYVYWTSYIVLVARVVLFCFDTAYRAAI